MTESALGIKPEFPVIDDTIHFPTLMHELRIQPPAHFAVGCPNQSKSNSLPQDLQQGRVDFNIF